MASVNYMTQVLFALNMIPMILNTAVRAMASAKRISEVLEEKPVQRPATQGDLELSQGERQLPTIACAVLAQAPILILDEATSPVDRVTENKIRRAMLSITKGQVHILFL